MHTASFVVSGEDATQATYHKYNILEEKDKGYVVLTIVWQEKIWTNKLYQKTLPEYRVLLIIGTQEAIA